jgi:predicted component of type VI protein secretion system
MAIFDFTDLYIKYPSHPNYDSTKVDEDDIVRVILQKYEMILFTNKGEVLGDPNFGADINRLLFQTKVSSRYVERIIREQIANYIPELNGIGYDLNITFQQNPNNYSDVMLIDFKVRGQEVNAFFA